MLVDDCPRDTREHAGTWLRRSDKRHGKVGIALDLYDTGAGKAVAREPQWAEEDAGPYAHSLHQHVSLRRDPRWLRRAPGGPVRWPEPSRPAMPSPRTEPPTPRPSN